MGYGTWPPVGWHHTFVIVWSKYRLRMARVVMNFGLTWAMGISTVLQMAMAVPLDRPNGR